MPISHKQRTVDEYKKQFISRFNFLKKNNQELTEKQFVKIEIRAFETELKNSGGSINIYSILVFLHDKLEEFESKKTEHVSNPLPISIEHSPKLLWNGNNNVLIDIFYQLMTMTNSKGQEYIPNGPQEVADFLQANFACFNDTKVSTIYGSLKPSKENQRPTQKNKIYIEHKIDLD
jgi:hypothetical protein